MSLARCHIFELEVHEVELSEESEEKERKVAAQKRVAQSRVALRVKKDMWWRMGTWWLWKAELAQELARACAKLAHDFAPGLPKSGTCLAELSKPCANLAQTLRCLAVLLHLVGGPLLKENVKHANGTQMSHWSFFAYYTFLESAHIYSHIFTLHAVSLIVLSSFLPHHKILKSMNGFSLENHWSNIQSQPQSFFFAHHDVLRGLSFCRVWKCAKKYMKYSEIYIYIYLIYRYILHMVVLLGFNVAWLSLPLA